MVYRTIDSPIGPLFLAGTRDALARLAFASERAPTPDPSWSPDTSGVLGAVEDELIAYFSGQLQRFRTPVAPRGTPFQQRVWQELCEIPYGQTISYGELARRIDAIKAVRAVGAANGANPIAIIVPCHRVIGANGSLTGFGGGLPTKRALLESGAGDAQTACRRGPSGRVGKSKASALRASVGAGFARVGKNQGLAPSELGGRGLSAASGSDLAYASEARAPTAPAGRGLPSLRGRRPRLPLHSPCAAHFPAAVPLQQFGGGSTPAHSHRSPRCPGRSPCSATASPVAIRSPTA